MLSFDYFRMLDRRYEERCPDRASILVSVCGKTIRLTMPNGKWAAMPVRNLVCFPDDGKMPADAEFFWMTDNIASLSPVPLKENEYLSFHMEEGECGYWLIRNNQLRAVDRSRSRYYLLDDNHIRTYWSVISHPMAKLFALWAEDNGMRMLHAASVGVDGKGILLVSRGGGGKSTLASSSFLAGFDFVSDDYCLIDGAGKLRSHPIFTNMAINPDMLAKMPALAPFLILPKQSEKPTVFVSPQKLCPSLPIHALLFPRIGGEEPLIEPFDPGKVLCQVVHSTVKQLGTGRDADRICALSKRLGSLPVYRFTVTPDLQTNTDYLKKWIGEL